MESMEKKLKKAFMSLKNRTENIASGHRSGNSATVNPDDDTPEADLLKAIRGFCEHGGPGSPTANEEYVYLPSIVDIAESSPSTAALAATTIRKNLDIKNASRPHVHYNSIMLMRILAENPGPTFTRNLNDQKFGAVVRELLRHGRDPSVWQMMCETLAHFSTDPDRIADEGLSLLREIWTREKKGMGNARKKAGGPPLEPGQLPPPAHLAMSSNLTNRSPNLASSMTPPLPPRSSLPPVEELVSRISEANTSAKLLEQVLQTTPTREIFSNELIKEFVQRCKLAQRSMKDYISADNPPPDEDTLTTLIETNDTLGIILDQHRNAVADALRVQETAGSNDNARVLDLGDLRHQDAAMHGAAVHDGNHSPVSPIDLQTTAQPITYRF